MKRSSGFTLMELILSAAIAAVVFTALTTVVAGGLTAWRKAEEISLLTRDGTKALQTIENQLLQSLASEDFYFEGSEPSLRFTINDGPGPAQIRWNYEKPVSGGQGMLVFTRTPIVPKQDASIVVKETRQAYSTVESVEFLFPYADQSQAGYAWQKKWTDANRGYVPRAVWIKLHLRGPRQGEIFLERMVVLPHGQLGTLEQAAP